MVKNWHRYGIDVSIIYPDKVYEQCANCLIENFLSLIPCNNCTEEMFCGELCASEAN